jgi:hypothetical protein
MSTRARRALLLRQVVRRDQWFSEAVPALGSLHAVLNWKAVTMPDTAPILNDTAKTLSILGGRHHHHVRV